MTQKTFLTLIGVILSVITAVHIARIALSWQVTVAGLIIPMWASWIAVVVGAYLAWQSFKFARNAN